MPKARGIGQSERVAVYEVSDDEMAAGSTLGGPKIVAAIKATGALQNVWSIEAGREVFGTTVLRHYDEQTGMPLLQLKPGTFRIHPEHQEHLFTLINDVFLHETVFVLSGPLDGGKAADPPAVYLMLTARNDGAATRRMATYAFAGLRGGTDHDVVATYDEKLHAF